MGFKILWDTPTSIAFSLFVPSSHLLLSRISLHQFFAAGCGFGDTKHGCRCFKGGGRGDTKSWATTSPVGNITNLGGDVRLAAPLS